MSPQGHLTSGIGRRPALSGTLAPPASVLPMGEQFLLWALRQWRCEVTLWDAQHRLPAGGSSLQRGFELAGLRHGLPHFAIVMDAFLCGTARSLEIQPLAAPFVGPDEGTLLALFSLAQDGLEGPLAACCAAMLPPENCEIATVQLKLFAILLNDAGLAGAPPRCGDGRWIH